MGQAASEQQGWRASLRTPGTCTSRGGAWEMVLPPESMDCGKTRLGSGSRRHRKPVGSDWRERPGSLQSGFLIVSGGASRSERVSLSGPRTWRKRHTGPGRNGKPIPWPVRVTTSLKPSEPNSVNLSLLSEVPSLWVPSGLPLIIHFLLRILTMLRLPPWPASLQGLPARHPGLE